MDFDKRPYKRFSELKESWMLKNPNLTLEYE